MGEVTGTVDEKDGTLTVGEADKATRYVKESDLLAVKEGREKAEARLKELESNASKENPEAVVKLEAANSAKLKAEADVERLTDELNKAKEGSQNTDELQKKLEAAQEAEKGTGNKLLELSREKLVATYKLKPEVVAEKNLEQLSVLEEALKAVVGAGGLGNFALGGGGGGSKLEGLSNRELARIGYEEAMKK